MSILVANAGHIFVYNGGNENALIKRFGGVKLPKISPYGTGTRKLGSNVCS